MVTQLAASDVYCLVTIAALWAWACDSCLASQVATLPHSRLRRDANYLIRLCSLMAPKSRERAFHAVVLKRSLVLTGGYSGKQFVPDTQEFDFICGGGEIPQADVVRKECVKISHKQAWLNEIATGEAMYMRPLARVRIVRELSQLVAGGDAAGPDAQMAALAFDSEDSDDAETPKKQPTPSKRRRKSNAPAFAGPETCKVVEVPEQPTPGSKKIFVHAALDRCRRLWLDTEALPWLIQYIRAEKASGGLQPVVDEPQAQPGSRIYWNFRDNNWIARAQAVDGVWLQASRGITRKQKSSNLDFESAKAAAFAELSEWVAKVDCGEITNKNADKADRIIRGGGESSAAAEGEAGRQL